MRQGQQGQLLLRQPVAARLPVSARRRVRNFPLRVLRPPARRGRRLPVQPRRRAILPRPLFSAAGPAAALSSIFYQTWRRIYPSFHVHHTGDITLYHIMRYLPLPSSLRRLKPSSFFTTASASPAAFWAIGKRSFNTSGLAPPTGLPVISADMKTLGA